MKMENIFLIVAKNESISTNLFICEQVLVVKKSNDSDSDKTCYNIFKCDDLA
jgi:hypothetical protein